MRSDEVIERLQRIRQFYLDTIKDDTAVEAVDMAINAVKKQEQDNNKSCITCKYKHLSVSEFPCSACFRSEFKDYYHEPCKAELTQREIRKEKEEAVIFFIVFSIFIFILCVVSIVID